MLNTFKNLEDLTSYFDDEQKCTDYFAAIRWPKGITCPHCNSNRKIHQFSDRRRYKCADCRKQFTVKVGTIFEESKVSLQKWLITFFFITSNGEGITSLKLSRDINVTQKTAWLMLQKILHMSQTRSFKTKLKRK